MSDRVVVLAPSGIGVIERSLKEVPGLLILLEAVKQETDNRGWLIKRTIRHRGLFRKEVEGFAVYRHLTGEKWKLVPFFTDCGGPDVFETDFITLTNYLWGVLDGAR